MQCLRQISNGIKMTEGNLHFTLANGRSVFVSERVIDGYWSAHDVFFVSVFEDL